MAIAETKRQSLPPPSPDLRVDRGRHVLRILLPVALALYATHRPRADVKPATLGVPYRLVVVRTTDGLNLTGWYAKSRNGAAVISFPTRLGKLDQARMLIRHGYGVLILDMRGYEGSDGAPNAFGWGSTKDIDAGVAWLKQQPDVREGGSAASASPSAASRCSKRPPKTRR